MDTITILRKLAAQVTFLTLSEALTIADVLAVPTLDTLDARVALVRRTPEIVRLIESGRYIQAIKELRTVGSALGQPLTLKDAKDAVDVVRGPVSSSY